MWHIPNKERICAHIFNVRALDAKQRINFFGLTLSNYVGYNTFRSLINLNGLQVNRGMLHREFTKSLIFHNFDEVLKDPFI